MVAQSELGRQTLADLSRRCREETDRFFARRSHDPNFCFELFRRALVDRSDMAWRLLFSQYRPLVASWVERQPAFPMTGEDVDYFINGAFARLMRAITPDSFAGFENLKSILGYLQLCVVSEVNDHARAQRDTETLSLEQINIAGYSAEDDVEQMALEDAERSELWSVIRSSANDDTELMVLYASYVLGIKPRQLVERYPERFDSVQRVYRIKENVLARLKRDPRMQGFL